MPLRTALGTYLFVGLAGLMALALVGRSATLVTLAVAGMAALGFTLALTMPIGRRVRRERLELAWWIEHPRGVTGVSLVSGASFSVIAELRHWGHTDLELVSLDPITSHDLVLVESPTMPVALPRGSVGMVRFRMAPRCAGRCAVHGLAATLRGPLGLFDVPLYFPSPLHVQVLPRSLGTRRPQRAATGMRHRVGPSQLSRRGGGTDLYEIREFVPGDPFRSIAWRASARQGRLMVKEVEHQVARAHWILLDAGGTMRGGAAGHRKIDAALDEAAGRIDRILTEGEQVGLLTLDERILSEHAPDEGSAHRRLLLRALLDTTDIVDSDLTQVNDRDVFAIVLRFLRLQGSVDFGTADSLHEETFAGYLRTMLSKEDPHARPVRAATELGVLARRYCRLEGLALPHRADPTPGSKDLLFAQALKVVLRKSQQPASLVLISDLDGLTFSEELLASMRMARHRGHSLTVVIADGRRLAPAPRDALERTLHTIYGHGEARRAREARRFFAPIGVHLESLAIAPTAPTATLREARA